MRCSIAFNVKFMLFINANAKFFFLRSMLHAGLCSLLRFEEVAHFIPFESKTASSGK